jgi:hypothetical protein
MRSVIAACAVAVALSAGCSDQSGSSPSGALTDLCAATRGGVGLDEQESAFFDRAHDALHDLARRATDVDPEAAADLLEAKQAVEAAFTESFDEPVSRDQVNTLIASANEALAALEEEPISC